MNNAITGFHHVALNVSKFEESISFYKALGLKEIRCWGEGIDAGVMLDMGDGAILEIFSDGGETAPTGAVIGHFALAVSDTDRAYAAALAAGALPDIAPKDIVVESATPFPARIAFVYSPSGERVELLQAR